MKAHTVSCESGKYLEQIISLWRKSSSTLGFFPEGAFLEYSQSRQILVVDIGKGSLAGYLLYRKSENYFVIVHLCIAEAYRSKGIAKVLVDKLTELARSCYGIRLKCRRDFSVSKLWPKLGFTAMGDEVGRSQQGYLLTVWKKENDNNDLFSEHSKTLMKTKIGIAIDANVFYGFLSRNNPEDDESKILLSEWLPDNIEFFLTEEIFNEINRNEDALVRESNRAYAQTFSKVPSNHSGYDDVIRELWEITKFTKSTNNESDIRQIAKSICGGLKYFITRDNGILKYSDAIFERFEILILRPSDLILYIDEKNRKQDYYPSRLSGTKYIHRLIRFGEQDEIADKFVNKPLGENRVQLLKFLQTQIVRTNESKCHICLDGTTPISIVIYVDREDGAIEIPLLRVVSSSVAKTIFRNMVLTAKIEAVKKGRNLTIITDKFIDKEYIEILQDESYIQTEYGFENISIPKALELKELIIEPLKNTKNVKHLGSFYESINKLKSDIEKVGAEDIIRFEKKYWPLKILDAQIDCYIIPIKPYYSLELFDYELANQDLLGASEIILNRELVYYRSSKPKILKKNARILWYVSKDDKYPMSGRIRACSYLNDMEINKPKVLYRKNKKLGVYSWSDVIKTAKNNIQNDLMCINFSDTVLFDKPIEWDDLKCILAEFGMVNNIQSPVLINNKVFASIYCKGFSCEN